jgi:hypothetical protein
VNHYTLTRPESKLTLHCTSSEWADETFDRLIRLGCSMKYALKVSRRIGRAVKV